MALALAASPDAHAQALANPTTTTTAATTTTTAATAPTPTFDRHAPITLRAATFDATASAPAGIVPSTFTDADTADAIAPGVFGTYGGRAGRLSNAKGPTDGWRAPIATQQLPDLGDGGSSSLTPQAERRLGERVMREIRRDPDYLGDWLVSDYLNAVAAKLAAAATTQYIGGYRPDFELFAVRDPQINAFSLPGGFIGVNTGLIEATQTESELAAVMAHEMGHVLQRHISRMVTAGEHSTYAALAGLLFGVLAGVVAHSGDLGSAIALGGSAYAVDNQLKFSRSAEHEADRVGFLLLTGAGYDPYAMADFFGKLERGSISDTGVPAYARTHPLTTDRMADMQDRARRSPYRQPHQAPEYGFVRARARLLQDRSPGEYTDEVSRMRTEIEDRTALNVAANWYGVAFGEMLAEHYDLASTALAEARRSFESALRREHETPRNGVVSSPSLDVLAADIARRAGRTDEAVHLAEVAETRWPSSAAAIDMHIQTLFAAKRFGDAQTLAHRQTQRDPRQPAWWMALAQASLYKGDTLEQHRALAEKLALDGAWPSAIAQLKLARDMKTVNYYQLATLDARLHEMEARYKEEREDEKSDS